jgi:hypothetical protein
MKLLFLLNFLMAQTGGFQTKLHCPDWFDNAAILKSMDMPVCPEGDQQVLVSENNPVGVVVVSATVNHPFSDQVIKKVLTGAGDKTPMIIVAGRKEEFDKLLNSVKEMPGTEAEKKRWLSSIVHAPGSPYPWQQDYMQSYVDPHTGKLIMSQITGYGRNQDGYNQFMSVAKDCGIRSGTPLSSERHRNGAAGGNIETLPGGICMLGDGDFEANEYEAYANKVCGKDRIKVPTSWLSVGHTDEIIKVVRNNRRQPPCDFSISVASPKKALELLQKDPNGSFLNFGTSDKNPETDPYTQRTTKGGGLSVMCRARLKLLNSKNPGESKKTNGQAKLFNLEHLLIYRAQAGSTVTGFPSNLDTSPDTMPPRPEIEDYQDCGHINNATAHWVFTQDENLKKFNDLVQKEMDKLKQEMATKLKEKFPSCSPDFIDLPDLFSAGEVPGNELPHKMGLSVLPNPTNAISINDTIISPEPSNATFKKYMDDEYHKRGLKTDYVDTFDLHLSEGNLHCGTNTMHMCQPRGNK